MKELRPEPGNPVEGETSTLDIHYAVMREVADPSEAYDPGPRWFYAFAVAALVIGGFYLGRHAGDFSTKAHIGYVASGNVTAAPPEGANAVASGASIYTGKCASCHQPNAQGLPGTFPPLIGSPFVVGDPVIPTRVVLRGLAGPVRVGGGNYNGVMPAWADQLSDAEIAAVISHIRALAPNAAAPVDAAFVAKIRTDTASRTAPWTAAELGLSGDAK